MTIEDAFIKVILVAVMTEKIMDLYVKDTADDIGQEGNIHTMIFWKVKIYG